MIQSSVRVLSPCPFNVLSPGQLKNRVRHVPAVVYRCSCLGFLGFGRSRRNSLNMELRV